jgi:hypothetical protein
MEQDSINKPITASSSVQLASRAELLFWGGSGIAQGILGQVSRGSTGALVQVKDDLYGCHLQGRKSATKAEQQASADYALAQAIANGRQQAAREPQGPLGRIKVDVSSVNERLERQAAVERIERRKSFPVERDNRLPVRASRPESERKLSRRQRIAAERVNKVAMAELRVAVASREECQGALASYVSTIASQATSRAARNVGQWRGSPVSEVDRNEALAAALVSVISHLYRLGHLNSNGQDWDSESVARMIPPAGASWAPWTIGAMRRKALFDYARKAAGRFLTAIPKGFSGSKGKFYLSFLSEWGRDVESTYDNDNGATSGFIEPTELAMGFETLPPVTRHEQFAKARAMIWAKLGCKPRTQWSSEVNARRAELAKVRRFALVAALLRGESAILALERAGLGQSWLQNGKLSAFMRDQWGIESAAFLAKPA